MKKNIFLSLCGFFLISTLFSCADDNVLGLTIQPGNDKISVAYDTVHIQSEMVLMDSIYLRSSLAMLGEFTNPKFGTTKSDYMGQLYCARNFSFPDDVTNVDSAFIYLYYNSWFGDSTAVHHVSVYELNNPLDPNKNYLTNTDVRDYCDFSKLIAQGTFTAGDVYTSDSVRALGKYSPAVKIPVDKALAIRFMNESRLHPEKFATPEAFQQYFKGIYITTDFGNGSLVYINRTEIEFCFNTWLRNKSNGLRDSLVVGSSYFPLNKEVKQINKIDHIDIRSYINPSNNDSINYIYSPAGLFTKVTVPEKLFRKGTGLLSGKTINSLRLKVSTSILEDTWKYALNPPKTLLLINEADLKSFFSGFKLSDGIHSFLGNYNSTNKEYVFDLSLYAQKMIYKFDGTNVDPNFRPFTKMILVPVNVTRDANMSILSIDNLLYPSAVRVRSGNSKVNPMTLQILYNTTK